MLTAAAVFLLATLVVLAVGPRMASTADRLGAATGLGGGLFGLVFLALATDIPEITLTPVAVLGGTPRIAVGSLLGSAAAQLVLIALVDIAFREGKLYERLPLRTSLGPCALMLSVLAVLLVTAASTARVAGVGVGTVLLPLVYLGVLAAIRGISTNDGAEGEASAAGDGTRSLWLRFAGFAVLLAGAGIALEAATGTIGSAIGLGETAAGALLAGVASSLPELVTAVAAARAGALELAVGDIVGSSALDVALLSWADLFYRDGSVFSLLGRAELSLIGVALALTSLLVVGLARGTPVAGRPVALETWLMIAVYVAGAVMLVTA